MKSAKLIVCLMLGAAATTFALTAWAADSKPAADAIDFDKARTLIQKQRDGGTLTPEERQYVERAKEARAQGAGRDGATRDRAGRDGAAASTSRPAGKATAGRPDVPPAADHLGLIPLNEMTAKDTYKGQDGGLYGGGSNEPPAPHAQAALKELAKIVPLDAAGKASPDGKIVFLSVGMSNTTHEFSTFKPIADKDRDKNPHVVVVDGAQSSQAAKQWNSADSKVWAEVQRRLTMEDVTAKQVQVVWLKQAQQLPAQLGEFPKHAEELKGDIIKDIQQVKAHYPNVRVLYLSSRIYAGYATSPLNPEPYAYEGGFVVRWIIQDQIKGDKAMNYDAAKGEVKAPLVLWGPYLWADGVTPRKSDGLVWLREDLRANDGTHPSETTGRAKVAKMLLNFVKTSPYAKSWYLKDAATSQPAVK